MRDRTAQTGPLTIGQQIVAWWETSTSASEPADLAEKIDAAIAAERKRCAEIADNGMLVPPDGGSPTQDEIDVAERIAYAIRNTP